MMTCPAKKRRTTPALKIPAKTVDACREDLNHAISARREGRRTLVEYLGKTDAIGIGSDSPSTTGTDVKSPLRAVLAITAVTMSLMTPPASASEATLAAGAGCANFNEMRGTQFVGGIICAKIVPGTNEALVEFECLVEAPGAVVTAITECSAMGRSGILTPIAIPGSTAADVGLVAAFEGTDLTVCIAGAGHFDQPGTNPLGGRACKNIKVVAA